MSHSTTMKRVGAVLGVGDHGLRPVGSRRPGGTDPEPTLREEAPKDLKIGSAVWGQRDLLDYDRKHPTEFQRILAAEFNSLTPENDMKWAEIHPEPGVYDFSGADAVVAFARANHQEVRGHTLLWHSQNPQWVIDASADWTCQEARDVLEDHIRTVVGRYAVSRRVGRGQRDLPGRLGRGRCAAAHRGQPVPQGVRRRSGRTDRRRLPVGARGRPEGGALPQRLQRRGHQHQDRCLLRPGPGAARRRRTAAGLRRAGAPEPPCTASTSRSRRTSSGSRPSA